MNEPQIVGGVLTREQLTAAGIEVPWADFVEGVVYEHPKGTKWIVIVYVHGKKRATLLGRSFEELRDKAAALNERR